MYGSGLHTLKKAWKNNKKLLIAAGFFGGGMAVGRRLHYLFKSLRFISLVDLLIGLVALFFFNILILIVFYFSKYFILFFSFFLPFLLSCELTGSWCSSQV